MFAKLGLLMTVVVFSSVGVRAAGEEADETERLKKELAAQRVLNEQLLERLSSLEAAQAAMAEQLASVAERVEDTSPSEEERESILEEVREEFGDLEERLNLLPTLSGYYDFEYFNDDLEGSPGEFRQHHVSLHLDKEWEDFRMFAEIEFEFGGKFEGDGGTALEVARGEVKVEQAWGEYAHLDVLTLRGGLILTPGYWNVNHYPNVVLSTRRPLMVRRVFREAITGAMAYGTRYWDDFGITYYAYLGNGESDFFTKEDDNEGKAVGGRVSFHLPTGEFFDRLDVGVSGYHESPSHAQRLRVWGFDAQVNAGPVEVLTEFARRNADEDRTGFYFQPSYRFNEKWATFYRYDILDVHGLGEHQEHTIGFNFRPIPSVSLKLEYFHSIRSYDDDFNGVATSIAIAF